MLLQRVTSIREKNDIIAKKTGEYFNLFDIIGIGTDELKICRFLYELINPLGLHYQGDVYLRTFISEVLKIEITDEELKTIRVYREYQINNKRRIDLVLISSNHFIPIEVKIYSSDVKNQCFDYLKLAKNSKLYYLSRFGDKPSYYSTGNLTDEEIDEKIACISFSNDILNWLKICVSEVNTIKIPSIRENIIQFMSVIRKFTNNMEDRNKVEIIEEIKKSPESMRSAVEIKKSVDEAGIEMLKKVFKAVEAKVANLGEGDVRFIKLDNEHDYKYNNYKKCEYYYRYNKSSCPGISYIYKRDVLPNIDILLRFEIDFFVVLGYCCTINGKFPNRPFTDEEKNAISNVLGFDVGFESWWHSYDFIPSDKGDLCPDFKSMNNSFLELFDDNKFEEFTNLCAKKIVEKIKNS